MINYDTLLNAFLNFLIRHDIYYEFVKNLNRQEIPTPSDFEKHVRKYLNEPTKLIFNGFSWDNTKKGMNYWQELHIEWTRECRNIDFTVGNLKYKSLW